MLKKKVPRTCLRSGRLLKTLKLRNLEAPGAPQTRLQKPKGFSLPDPRCTFTPPPQARRPTLQGTSAQRHRSFIAPSTQLRTGAGTCICCRLSLSGTNIYIKIRNGSPSSTPTIEFDPVQSGARARSDSTRYNGPEHGIAKTNDTAI